MKFDLTKERQKNLFTDVVKLHSCSEFWFWYRLYFTRYMLIQEKILLQLIT